MKKVLALITVTGLDRPGITAALMGVVMNHNANVEDIGQSILHEQLSLSFLVRFETQDEASKSPLLKELKNASSKMGMELNYKFITDRKEITPDGQRYLLSCISPKGITASFIHDISSNLAHHKINIQRIDNTSHDTFTSVEFVVTAQVDTVNWDNVKEDLIKISNAHTTDMALLKDDVWLRSKRLIVMDMDSTLIQNEVIDEIAKAYGVGEEVSSITELAMNGKIDFDESLTRRVALLKDFPENKLKEILDNISLTLGAEEFIETVKKIGYKVAIISGGFTYFAKHFKEKLDLDYVFANELEIINGKLTGKIKGSIVNAEKKALLLELISQQENIRLEQVVAIGDGANDLPMLAKAGLGIAFHAKDIVKKSAKQHMSHGPMTSILYFLGIQAGPDL